MVIAVCVDNGYTGDYDGYGEWCVMRDDCFDYIGKCWN